jgi:hypothetical protein
MATEIERLNLASRAAVVCAPKGGTATGTARLETPKKVAIGSGGVVAVDLTEWVGRWATIRTETADAGWFCRPKSPVAGHNVDPAFAATTSSNPGQQCARQVAGDAARPFPVEAGFEVVAAIGSATGVMILELADL